MGRRARVTASELGATEAAGQLSVHSHRLRVVTGDLVQTTNGEVDHAGADPMPKRAHPRPRTSLVGHVACLGHGGGGHRSREPDSTQHRLAK